MHPPRAVVPYIHAYKTSFITVRSAASPRPLIYPPCCMDHEVIDPDSRVQPRASMCSAAPPPSRGVTHTTPHEPTPHSRHDAAIRARRTTATRGGTSSLLGAKPHWSAHSRLAPARRPAPAPTHPPATNVPPTLRCRARLASRLASDLHEARGPPEGPVPVCIACACVHSLCLCA